MIEFFARSEFLDYDVLRPLSHIRPNWELQQRGSDDDYESEEGSFAQELDSLIDELEAAEIPLRYHDNEDLLAEYVREKFDQEIRKVGNRWVGSDYRIILQDGGIFDIDEKNLVQSARGRIEAATTRGQNHYDQMEPGHRKILACILTLILYHRANGTKQIAQPDALFAAREKCSFRGTAAPSQVSSALCVNQGHDPPTEARSVHGELCSFGVRNGCLCLVEIRTPAI